MAPISGPRTQEHGQRANFHAGDVSASLRRGVAARALAVAVADGDADRRRPVGAAEAGTAVDRPRLPAVLPPARARWHPDLRRQRAYMSWGAGIYPDLTVRQNLWYFASARPCSTK